jgi:uncharacterized membrane protein YdbT with pleckstrin-like domain
MSQVIDRFRSSTLGWLLGTLAGWGTLLLIPAGLAGVFFLGSDLFFALPAIAVLILIGKWLSNLATTYEITDERLILHKGILRKSIDEVELYRVKDVRIDFTVINQMADIGTITITSSDETTSHGALVIRDVDKARARRETLRTLVDAARRQRGVREIDMVHEDIAEPDSIA